MGFRERRRPATGLGLATDLYALTMVDAYLSEGMLGRAVFSLTARRLPERRAFLLAAGLSDALDGLEKFRFSPADLAYLDTLGLFSERLLAYLERFQFTGDVRAVPEGTPVFAHEPLVEVAAPLPQAQLVESLVVNRLQLQTVAASTAVRMIEAARGRPLVDFGMRRAHGIEASVEVARAAYLAGFAGTSNVLAGKRYGIPVLGTMAHSFVQAYRDERDAFRAFLRRFPRATLLVDTYDTREGVRRAIELARALPPDAHPRAIRLDSGDLGALARACRALLDEAGLRDVEIFASGGLDEHGIDRLVSGGAPAPIDGFGEGTALAVSESAPSLDVAYKLVAFAGEPRMKLSTGKVTYPHPKQVFRCETDGAATHDVLACEGESLDGHPLLQRVMQGGARLEAGREPLESARRRARDEVARLPPRLRALGPSAGAYPVRLSPQLERETARLAGLLRARHLQAPPATGVAP